jgi:hypothetical protein
VKRLLGLLGFALSSASAMAASFQPVTRISCPGGEFIVDARPYDESEAGSSATQLRYRYRGIELAAINYETYYKNLDAYLHQGDPPIFNLGLNLNTTGRSASGGTYEMGDTLYLPPSTFSQAEVQDLSDCLVGEKAQLQLRHNFESAVIRSSTFLGLMRTEASIGRTGVARLVRANAPLTGIYGRDWFRILVERRDRVLLHTNFTVTSTAESVVWGNVVTNRHGKPTLQAPRYIQFNGEQLDMTRELLAENRTGRRLQDDYRLEWQ